MSQVETEDTFVPRIIAANSQIPAKGCRAQHATDGGHYKATFEVHDLTGTDLAQGLFAEAARYPALIRYSNGKEQDASKPDVHGMAIKVLAPKGERLLTDPDDVRAIDFVLIDVDTFFSDDLGDYTLVNEHLVPLLQRKQISDDEFSFWEALGGLISTVFSIRLDAEREARRCQNRLGQCSTRPDRSRSTTRTEPTPALRNCRSPLHSSVRTLQTASPG